MSAPPEKATTSEAASSSAVPLGANNAIVEQLRRLQMQEANPKKVKDKYQFWETQPVAQFHEDPSSTPLEDGPIDKPKTLQDVRQEPYNLPTGFDWCTVDVSNAEAVKEVYELLYHNYVEDDDNMFRFNYSPGFLQWALQPPGYKLEWLLGVRVAATKKLVGFISGIPCTIRVNSSSMPMVEINFLCVHKKLRSKRLAPVLIKEVTRRVNMHNIWQAAYTAGVVIPKPVATCRYWHRSLNPKKLIEVNFSRLAPRMTMARTIKLYKLADEPATVGIRPMQAGDVVQVQGLLADYLGRFKLAPQMDEHEVAHWLLPREGVVYSYVVEGEPGRLQSLLSFYSLPSSVLGHPEHKDLHAAYMFYCVPGPTPMKQLLNDALILARSNGFDVFNALDIMENEPLFTDLKFGKGDGQLNYYCYNWRVAQQMRPSDVGLVLL